MKNITVSLEEAQIAWLQARKDGISATLRAALDVVIDKERAGPDVGAALVENEQEKEARDFWNAYVRSDEGQRVVEEMAYEKKTRKTWWLLPCLEEQLVFMAKMKQRQLEG